MVTPIYSKEKEPDQHQKDMTISQDYGEKKESNVQEKERIKSESRHQSPKIPAKLRMTPILVNILIHLKICF